MRRPAALCFAFLCFFAGRFVHGQGRESITPKAEAGSARQASLEPSQLLHSEEPANPDKPARNMTEADLFQDKATTPSATRRDATELYELQAQLAEHAYAISKSNENRDALVMAYEKLAGLVCMPELFKTLSYPGPPKETIPGPFPEPGCLELLNKIQALDPQNAFATCALNGTESRPCQVAFGAQEVRELTSSLGWEVPAAVEMELKVHLTKNQEILKKLDNEFKNSSQTWRAQPSSDNLAAMRKILAKILAIACKITLLRLEPSSLTPPPKQPRDELAATVAALQRTPTTPAAKGPGTGVSLRDFDIFSAKTSGPEKESPPPQALKRVRLLPPSCLSYINQALKLTPLLPEPVCYREGFYTPACISALKDARLRFRQQSPSASKIKQSDISQDGLTSF